MTRLANDFLLSVSYFTRLPVAGLVDYSGAGLERAVGWFPFVGWLVAAATVGVLGLAGTVLPLEVAVLLSMAAGILFTGAFHEDGLADTADGFGPVADREKALAVMKDSRLGTFGALGLGLVLSLKFLALSGFGDVVSAALALVVAHPLSRLAVVAVVATQPYVSQNASRSRAVAEHVPASGWLLALPAALLPLAVFVAWPAASLILGTTAVITVLLVIAFRRRFGGYTGDTLGALQQISEVGILLGLLAA